MNLRKIFFREPFSRRRKNVFYFGKVIDALFFNLLASQDPDLKLGAIIQLERILLYISIF